MIFQITIRYRKTLLSDTRPQFYTGRVMGTALVRQGAATLEDRQTVFQLPGEERDKWRRGQGGHSNLVNQL